MAWQVEGAKLQEARERKRALEMLVICGIVTQKDGGAGAGAKCMERHGECFSPPAMQEF